MIEKDLKVRARATASSGPAIYDMKAGGYIAYYALRHLLRQGKKTRLPVTFLFIPEEEVGSPTRARRIEEAARGHKYALVMERPGRRPGRDLAQGRRPLRHDGQGPRQPQPACAMRTGAAPFSRWRARSCASRARPTTSAASPAMSA